MLVTTEKRTRMAKRGTALAIVGGVLLVLLSLPLVRTLFPHGIRVGEHGIQARFASADPIYQGLWTEDFHIMGTSRKYFRIGWNTTCYDFEAW